MKNNYLYLTNNLKKMKFLKYLFFLLLIVIIGVSIYFGTKDGTFNVASSKEIAAPSSLLFETVNDFKTWKKWGPWMEEDPNIKIEYGTSTNGEGASYSWKSDVEEVGNGSMKTLSVTEDLPNNKNGKEIHQEITFNTPFGDSKSNVYWRFEPIENTNKTKVTWGMKGEQTFMEKVFMSFQKEPFDKMLTSMFDKGLANLEKEVQDQMKKYTITVNGITEYGGGYYLYKTSATRINQIGNKMGPLFGQIMGFIKQNNVDMAGMPFTIYNEIDQTNGTVIFSTAIPVKEKVITPAESDILSGYMAPSTTVKVTLQGNYNYLSEAYKKAKEYIVKNNLELAPNGKMFEVYKTDPEATPNPANWITEIFFPVSKPQPKE